MYCRTRPREEIGLITEDTVVEERYDVTVHVMILGFCILYRDQNHIVIVTIVTTVEAIEIGGMVEATNKWVLRLTL